VRRGDSHSERPCFPRAEFGQGILGKAVEFAFRIVFLDLAIPAFSLKFLEPERESFKLLSAQMGHGFLDLLQLCHERFQQGLSRRTLYRPVAAPFQQSDDGDVFVEVIPVNAARAQFEFLAIGRIR